MTLRSGGRVLVEGGADAGWVIRRNGVDELCLPLTAPEPGVPVTPSPTPDPSVPVTRPPVPPSSSDVCTVTSTSSGVVVEWSDLAGREQLRTSSSWVATVASVTSFTVADGSVVDGYRIRRNGTDEVCQVAS